MTNHNAHSAEFSLSIGIARRIDALSDEFEAALLSGTQPSIEDYLLKIGQQDREELLRELLPLELDAQVRGPAGTLDDCLVRFGDQERAVRDVFLEREPPLTWEEFVDAVEQSGLIAQGDLQPYVETEKGCSFTLSRRLVDDDVLTPYQSRVLLERSGDPLVLGDYAILDWLGQGGMGQVYKARHRRMERIVAIKTLSAAVSDNEQALARFHREVKAAARLVHPHIVTAYDAGTDNGIDYLVMEFVDGNDLWQTVKAQGRLPLPTALDCVLQAARGIEFAHAQGIIHRDIKPPNLLMDRKGTVKVLDMGLARLEPAEDGRSAVGTELTGSGSLMGTVDYMAPEQAENTKRAGSRSDIYSLGITMHYLLTGRVAYQGETVVERLLAHREQPIPSLQDSTLPMSGVSGAADVFSEQQWKALDGIFQRMVAKDPEHRYQSMTELIQDLEPLARSCRTRSPECVHFAFDAPQGEQMDRRVPQFGPTDPTQLQGEPSREASSTKLAPLLVDPATDTWSEVSLDETHISIQPVAKPVRPQKKKRGSWPTVLVGMALLGVLLAGIVITLDTPAGTVVLEIDDPAAIGAQVHINGEQVITVQRTGHLPIKVQASAREQLLQLKQGGTAIFAKSFTVKDDGGEGRVRVTLQPAKQLAKQPAIATPSPAPATGTLATGDRERAAAAWVVEQGGQVSVLHNRDEIRHVSKIEGLPNGAFLVHAVSLEGLKAVNDTGLENLTGLAALELLSLEGTGVTDASLEIVSQWKKLFDLELSDTQVTGAGLRHLSALPRLSRLHVRRIALNNSDLVHLVEMPSLAELDLQGTGVTDAGLVTLLSLPNLTHVSLRYTAITDAGAAQLAKLEGLKSLALEGTKLTDVGLSQLRSLKNLTGLDVRRTKVTEQGVKELEQSLLNCNVQFNPTPN